MRKTVSMASVLASATCLVVATTTAFAATPTQADFDACNRVAQSKVSAPSASPKTDTSRGQSTSATQQQQAAPSEKPASEARVDVQADQLRGIAEKSKNDPAYQRAYRACMKERGF